MKALGLVAAVVAATAIATPAAATTDPAAAVRLGCVDGRAVATFTYTGFSARNLHLAATQTLDNHATASTKTFRFAGPGATDTMSIRATGRTWAMTQVRAANGRLKASASASIVCAAPDPVRPSARFEGPCGDPFYRAVLNNRRSERPVTFRVSYQPFGEPRETLVRRVGAHKRLVTHWFDVAGLTRMTIHADGRLLVAQRSAPNRVYRPCW